MNKRQKKKQEVEFIKRLEDNNVYAVKFPEKWTPSIVGNFLSKYKEICGRVNKNIEFIPLCGGTNIVGSERINEEKLNNT